MQKYYVLKTLRAAIYWTMYVNQYVGLLIDSLYYIIY